MGIHVYHHTQARTNCVNFAYLSAKIVFADSVLLICI
jgi:hypothetical protein